MDGRVTVALEQRVAHLEERLQRLEDLFDEMAEREDVADPRCGGSHCDARQSECIANGQCCGKCTHDRRKR
jgi:hypothetical protein